MHQGRIKPVNNIIATAIITELHVLALFLAIPTTNPEVLWPPAVQKGTAGLQLVVLGLQLPLPKMLLRSTHQRLLLATGWAVLLSGCCRPTANSYCQQLLPIATANSYCLLGSLQAASIFNPIDASASSLG
jgi:hypothetical protein